MFNNMNDIKRILRDENEDLIIEKIEKQYPVNDKNNKGIDDIRHYFSPELDSNGCIKPVVFVDKNTVSSNLQLFADPLEVFKIMNWSALNNFNIALSPLENRHLNELSLNNEQLLIDIVLNYIKSQSILSFFNFFESNIKLKKLGILEFLDIKERLINLLDNNVILKDFVSYFLKGGYSVFNIKNEEDGTNKMLSVSVYAQHVAYQISLVLYNILFKAVEESVNDVIYQVHTIPNINQIYNNAKKIYTYLNKFSDAEFKFQLATLIKDIFVEDSGQLFDAVIIPGISSLFFYLNDTFFYLFNDLYISKLNERKAKINNNVNI